MIYSFTRSLIYQVHILYTGTPKLTPVLVLDLLTNRILYNNTLAEIHDANYKVSQLNFDNYYVHFQTVIRL